MKKPLVRKSLDEGFLDKFKKKPEEEKLNLPVEDFGGEKSEKIQPKEGYDLDRFYATIQALRERDQEKRKEQLVNTFFRNFIGKPLLNSTIKNFNADVFVEDNYFGLDIRMEDGSRISYSFHAEHPNEDKATIYPLISNYQNSEEKMKMKREQSKVSRKDARTIGLITKKFNPETKYAKGTGDLEIKEY